MKYPPVTVAMLIYRSPEWLNFALGGLAYSKNRTPCRVLVVGNDAEPQVMETGRVDVDHRNEPGMRRMARIYAAWNRAVKEAETDLVVLMNSDMVPHHGWLDALVEHKTRKPKSLPCSLLVESGRIPSAIPEYVRNFGITPDGFDHDGFSQFAESIRSNSLMPGRLYMPVLFDKREFLDVGGYPPGNPPGTTGDKDLFARYAKRGFEHVTVMDSVVYHVQVGEAGEWYGDD